MIGRAPRREVAALCTAFALVQLAAFHWGVITPDTVVQYGQAVSGHYDDWHPPATAWLLRQLRHLGPGGAPLLLLDIALYWGAFGLIADVMRARHGWSAASAVLLIGLLPIPFGQVGAVLKDELLTCVLLMATALLIRREEGGPGWLALVALPLVLLAGTIRINAPFAALPMLMLAIPRRWTASLGRGLASAAVGLILLLTTGWAINQAMLRPHHSHPIFSLVNFDLAGIIAQGGPNLYPGLDDTRARAITARCYDPHLYGEHDPPGCAVPQDGLADHVARTGDSPIGIWLNAVIAAPGPYLRHRMAHVNRNWRLMVPGVPDDAMYLMSQPNDFGLRFVPSKLTRAVHRAALLMAWSPLGRPATWLAVALGLLVAAPRLASRRAVTALAASSLCYGGAYAVVSVSTDLRYNVWTMLAAMLGLAIAVAERSALSWPRRAVALVPAMLVIVVEIVGLVGTG